MNLAPEIQNKVEQWLSGNFDGETQATIQKLIADNNTTELIDSFYQDLEFGTGGLRGIMGVGTNRMNKYTIGMATQGLANYLKMSFPDQKIKVAIAHDSRNNSPYFAQITADVFSANDIQVYLFSELRPTPELSFAIRELGCQSGVVVTASHNPKEYNGYKAYWTDGSQLVAPHDKNVITEVQKIKVDEVKFTRNEANVQMIGEEIDAVYLAKIEAQSINPQLISEQKDLKIVYTSIHGTGIRLVPKILAKLGFSNVNVVEEQAEPDGNFPTVVYPNPEEAEALHMALEKAKKLDADLLMGTDPDADRVGIAVKNHHNEWQLLNGNQTGALLVYYLINAWKKAGKLTGKEFIAKTIVTSTLLDEIARKNGVKCYNTLTGFKYIAEIIRNLEGKEQFIGGGEESYGYMIGDFVRDKDAIASCAMIAEMVAVAKAEGKSLFDKLIDMYLEYGFYLEKLVSITKKGKSGQDDIKQMMENFRQSPPKTLAGSRVVKMMDYHKQLETNLLTGETQVIEMEKSNVLQFFTEVGDKISARPSGTEPKIKFYFSVRTDLANRAEFDATEQVLEAKIKTIIGDLGV
ncbi:MAG: phospho-sugar mutase [Microscillaceae bacterium]|jgi:phosphoglucomutase|nr:phospho-sugar mutase [Microscillaceae bacterium]